MTRPRVASLAVLLVAFACTSDESTSEGSPPDGEEPLLRLQEVARAERPVHLAAPPRDARLFVVEQGGRIWILRDDQFTSRPFLDIRDRVRSGGERGLLSVAFHPDYSANGLFYVDYTDREGATRVSRFQVTEDPDAADPSSEVTLLRIPQPYANHNGGQLAFGPDGMLYIGMGDGGSAGDPMGHGQNTRTLLGAMLRLDVDAGSPYAVPPDNPFADGVSGRPEIWAFGLRNPWRFSFDRVGGHLYIADVGQNRVEEVNVVAVGEGGLNFGWNVLEGSRCFTGECDPEGFTSPLVEYDHEEGCSVTGGHVYRGSALPGVVGHYFYSDYCQGWIRSFRFEEGAVTDNRVWDLGDAGNVVSFGEDSAGELYVLTEGGTIYRVEARD